MTVPVRLRKTTKQPCWPWAPEPVITVHHPAPDPLSPVPGGVHPLRNTRHIGDTSFGGPDRADETVALYAPPRSAVSSGVRAFCVAMIDCAHADLVHGTLPPRTPRRSPYYPDPVSARAWIDSPSDRAPSFCWVCDALGLDAAAVRREMERPAVAWSGRRRPVVTRASYLKRR